MNTKKRKKDKQFYKKIDKNNN